MQCYSPAGLDGVNLLKAFKELAKPFDGRDLDEVVARAPGNPRG
jgi:hypothetical protein